MKKILLVVLIGFLSFFICCVPSTTKVRNVEGTIISVSKAEFNDFDGNFVIWQKKHSARRFLIDIEVYQTWFICPLQEFPKIPFKLQLNYKWIQQVLDIPIVRVVNLKILKENY